MCTVVKIIFLSDDQLWTPSEECAFTVRPKSTPTPEFLGTAEAHQSKFSGFFDLFLHWVSVGCGVKNRVHNQKVTKIYSIECIGTLLRKMGKSD